MPKYAIATLLPADHLSAVPSRLVEALKEQIRDRIDKRKFSLLTRNIFGEKKPPAPIMLDSFVLRYEETEKNKFKITGFRHHLFGFGFFENCDPPVEISMITREGSNEIELESLKDEAKRRFEAELVEHDEFELVGSSPSLPKNTILSRFSSIFTWAAADKKAPTLKDDDFEPILPISSDKEGAQGSEASATALA